MGQTDGRIGRVDALAARTGSAEQIQTDILPLEIDIELAGLRENGHRGGGGLDPSLGLGLRNPLDTVDTGLIFHDPVDSLIVG